MKKRMICLVTALLLALSISVPALASQAYSTGSSLSTLDTDTIGPGSSLQLMLAKLQLAQAEIMKEQIEGKMEQIQTLQAEQRLVSGYLNAARQAKSNAESSGSESEIPADMAQYMGSNGLSYGGDMLLSAEEWDVAIASLTSRLEQLSAQTQQEMIYMQDYLGQYNSYLNGANQQINTTNQTLTNLARGQSMYGDSDAGLAVTALAIGLVLGCLITVSVQKIRRKAQKA